MSPNVSGYVLLQANTAIDLARKVERHETQGWVVWKPAEGARVSGGGLFSQPMVKYADEN